MEPRYFIQSKVVAIIDGLNVVLLASVMGHGYLYSHAANVKARMDLTCPSI